MFIPTEIVCSRHFLSVVVLSTFHCRLLCRELETNGRTRCSLMISDSLPYLSQCRITGCSYFLCIEKKKERERERKEKVVQDDG